MRLKIKQNENTQMATALVGEVPETFSQKRKIPRLPLILIALVVGGIGAYILIHSFAATNGSLIFQDSFESGKFDSSKWYVQALPGRASVNSGGAADGNDYAHFQVKQGDVEPDTGSSRAEISGPTFSEGQDLFIEDSIRIPSGVTYSGSWQLIQQLHETNWGGSPGTAVFLNTTPRITLGTGSGKVTYWASPTLQHDKWYKLIYHIKLSQDSSVGFMEVWLDGVQQKLSNGQTRMYNKTIQTSQTYLKAGIYRSGSSTGTSLVDHDNIAVGTSYDAVNGTVTAPPPDTSAPVVSVTSPSAGSSVSGQVTLTASATDNTGVQKVEFYADGKLLTTDTTAPYTTSWDTAAVAPGSHAITAKAYDASGNVGVSPSVTVNVMQPGSILFKDGFESGTFSQWYVQALASRITLLNSGAFSGSKAVRFEVRDGDAEPDTGSERAELSGPTFNEGQDLYVRDAVRMPSTVTYQGPWQIIQQLHETNWGGSPGIALFLDRKPTLKLEAGDGSPDYWNSATLQAGRWYDLVYHVKLSKDPSVGLVEVWLDGAQQKLTNGQTSMHGQTIQSDHTYLKIGIYRSKSSTGTSQVDHDNIVVGTSYAAVSSISP